MNRTPETPAQIEARLTELRARLARLNGQDFTHELARHFPLGSVGGSGKQAKRLNARRSRAIEGTIDRAKAALKVQGEINSMEMRLKRLRGELPPLPVLGRAARNRKKQGVSWAEISPRQYEVRLWYFFGPADAPPPFGDLQEEEISALYTMRVPPLEDAPQWVRDLRARYLTPATASLSPGL